MTDAAREYEAAYEEEHAPDLLYRLGIVRRKLKQYGKAREALRAYLREAPEGGLREEAVRQLAKLDVLIEAQSEDYSDEPPRRQARAGPPGAQVGEQRSLPPSGPVNNVHQPPAPPPPGSPLPPSPAPAGEQRSLPPSEPVNSVHQPEPLPSAAMGAAVPAAAVAPSPGLVVAP